MEPKKTERMAEPAVPEAPHSAPPKTPKTKEAPIRRVGSLTLGVSLVALGVFFLCYFFVPNFNWELVLRIAPAVGLCLLGCEVLWFAAKPQRWKYDFLSVLICLLLMAACFFMSVLPIVLDRFSPETEARATKIATEYEDTLYADFSQKAPDIQLKDMAVWLRNYYGTAETVTTAQRDLNSGLGTLHLNVELYGPYEQKAAFAIDCRKLTDIIQQQALRPAVVTFYYDGVEVVDSEDLHSGSMKQDTSYTLTLSGAVQLDWTADMMAKQTEEANLLDEENTAPAGSEAEE